MRYRSTRGGVEDCGFVDAVLMGLAPDRGLLVPKEIPKVDAATLEKWSKLPFAALATEIISLYIDESAAPAVATRVAVDSKTDYPVACNSVETLLIHRKVRRPPRSVV